MAHCIVVGHGPGIGEAVARAFAAEGMSISLLARDAARVQAAAGRIGAQAAGFAADASEEASLLGAIAAATQRFGDADVLVYNAARWRPGPVLAMAPEDMLADLRICTTGALAAARAVAPAMVARRSGSLLFTGGGFALHPSPTAPALSIGKAGIRALALMLAQELAPAGVRVGTVTVMGMVQRGTRFDPDAIAAAFLALHRRPADPWNAEVQFA